MSHPAPARRLHATTGGGTRPRPRHVLRTLACTPVQLSIVALNIAYAVIGVVLMYVSYRVFDRLSKRIDLQDELRKGNVAVAIFIGSLFIAIAMIISGAMG
jgi:putative membrane protein